MPLPISTINETRQRMVSDYELRYQQAGITVDAHTRGTGHTEKVNAISAVAHGLKLNQRYIVEQIFIDTMDEANLIKAGGEYGLIRIAPKFAFGAMDCTGTNGVAIPQNAVVKHANGIQYRVTTETVISGLTNVPLIAIETGIKGNLNAGETLNFVNPIVGVDSEAVVDANGLTAGADIEPISRYRSRVKTRRQQPPMGGKWYDYEEWAKAASVDVTDAWISPHENEVGQIILRFVTENLASPIPSPALITVVEDYVNNMKPVEANLLVEAPTENALDLTFSALSPNTINVQAAVLAELDDLLKNEVRSDTTLYLNKLRAAISGASGLEDFTLTLNANVAVGIDEYLVLGTTTFPAI